MLSEGSVHQSGELPGAACVFAFGMRNRQYASRTKPKTSLSKPAAPWRRLYSSDRPTPFAQTFEVASIRQNTTGGAQHYGPTADGYRVSNLPLLVLIVTAYPPQLGESAIFTDKSIVDLPEWALKENYDITAKVAESDLAAWQDPARQPAMLRVMLQRLLKERCKLAVRSQHAGDAHVYLLVVGKSGPKLKASDPAVPHPAGLTLPGGGLILPENGGRTMHFYETSMATLAPILSTMTERPVQETRPGSPEDTISCSRESRTTADLPLLPIRRPLSLVQVRSRRWRNSA